MLTSLEIKNFKCFSELKVSPLAKVNLFVGAGNSGKTSLLEAVSWLPHQAPGEVFGAAGNFRDQSLEPQNQSGNQRWFFHDLNESKDIRITATLQAREWEELVVCVSKRQDPDPSLKRVGRLNGGFYVSWSPAGAHNVPPIFDRNPRMIAVNTDRLPAHHLAVSYDRWTLKTENEGRLVQFLQAVDIRLKSLRPMEPHGQRMMYADVGLPERIPLPMLGEGFNRLLQVFGVIIGEGAEIVLVDEIENGLHWKALPQVWTGLKAAVSSSSAQIFATTHSYECIKAAIEVFRGEPRGELAVHRLERRDDGQIHCVTIEEEMLEQAVEAHWEIR